ncbi:serine protease FAM111A-like [Carcharodon carcharias]|uniref:serine protease FAM111A-like n=1 Tax=Carcharodon carcharias TaxID=13397 RepID=UPI001B7EC1F9|nr:serine protease FAM111A-like [Carcharodon carcharias]XP_041029844.1 serine protease FAM111A-like [Carcharodon carcharias]XP_041029845.1 serine protease FAM111A-like [Carcharodon carcharias]
MPPKQPRRSKSPLKPLGKESMRPFVNKVNNENQSPVPLLGKKTHTERREPLSERNGSNGTGKMPEAPAGKVTEHSEEDRVKEFTFSFQRNSTEHVARGKLDENLHSVLMSSEAFKEEQGKNKGKNFHIIGKREFMGAVNLGMPCKCLPEKAHFEVIFYRDNGEMCYRADDSSGKECVVFQIRSTGKSAGKLGTAPKHIIKCESLRGNGYDLCVYAFAGETIREALCKDRRFLPIIEQNMWNLVEGQRSLPFSLTVNDLHNEHFEVKLSNTKFKAGNKEENASASKNQEEENVPGGVNELLHNLVMQVDQSLGKERGSKYHQKQWKLLKAEYGKVTSDGIPIIVHEMLVRLSEAVGFVKWNNNGIQGTASCFHLRNGHILTCYHVVKMIIGDGVPEDEWEAIVEKSMKVNFSYKEEHPTSGWYEVDPWFEVYSLDLDYAVLRLKACNGHGSQLPPGVSPIVIPPPRNGVVYIIGHPDGVRKSTDTCIVIPLEQRKIGYYIHAFGRYSFREIQSPDKITYNSCFFHGASGSPVFNSSGLLVGMHAGGYDYNIGSKINSVIEYGPTIKAIADHMEKQHPEFVRSLFISHDQRQDEQNIPSNNQEEVPMDVE